jgi:two-component system sensor histidine kinase KdpD
VAATPHAPFFGPEDRDLVNAIAALTEIALERVAEAEREREIRAQLERLNALQNEFVAVVAHDLRSPMVVIAGYADLLVDRADRFDAEDRREMLRTISRTVKKLARFVEDVLQVARIESGDFSYRIAPFELLPVVHGAVQDVAATGTRDRVEVVAPTTLPTALGDPERHWQILTNLLSNALKFSPPGTPIRVTVSDGDMLRVAVEDQGAGIAADDVDKLFLKFSRLTGDGRRARSPGQASGCTSARR